MKKVWGDVIMSTIIIISLYEHAKRLIMTIDEYLNELQRLKGNQENAYAKLEEAEARLMNSNSILLSTEGRGSRDVHAHEKRLAEYSDIAKEWRDITARYDEIRHQVKAALDYVLYWEGNVLNLMYIYNLYFGFDLMDGVDEVLNLNDEAVIHSRIKTAKAHLAEILRSQGLDIDRESV